MRENTRKYKGNAADMSTGNSYDRLTGVAAPPPSASVHPGSRILLGCVHAETNGSSMNLVVVNCAFLNSSTWAQATRCQKVSSIHWLGVSLLKTFVNATCFTPPQVLLFSAAGDLPEFP